MFGYENENRRGPGRWIQYIFETALIIAASGYLIRLGVRFFLEVLVGAAHYCGDDSRSSYRLAYLEKPAWRQVVKEAAL